MYVFLLCLFLHIIYIGIYLNYWYITGITGILLVYWFGEYGTKVGYINIKDSNDSRIQGFKTHLFVNRNM